MEEKVLRNTSIHYWINGAKVDSAIVFIHPAFGDHSCFDAQLDYFKDYRITLVALSPCFLIYKPLAGFATFTPCKL